MKSLPKNNTGLVNDTSTLETAAHRTVDDGRTDTDLLEYNLPYRVYELYQHLEEENKISIYVRTSTKLSKNFFKMVILRTSFSESAKTSLCLLKFSTCSFVNTKWSNSYELMWIRVSWCFFFTNNAAIATYYANVERSLDQSKDLNVIFCSVQRSRDLRALSHRIKPSEKLKSSR